MNNLLKSTFACAILLLSNSSIAQDKYEEALSAFNQQQVGEAYILLKNTLRDNPDHLPSKLLMGRILLIDGFILDAIDEFEESLQLGADKNLALPYLSTAYLMQGEYDLVVNLADSQSISTETKIALKLNAASAYIRQNKPTEAESEYQQILKLSPNNLVVVSAYADMLISVGNLDGAEDLLLGYRTKIPSSAVLLHAFGKLQHARGQKEEALETFKKVDNLQPSNPLFMRSLAAELAELGDYEEARKVITKIEQQTPADIQIRLLKARILALTKQQFEADKILQQLTQELSLLDEKQRNERIQLSVVTGIVAYINQNYELASTELARYVSERTPSPEIIGMLADSLLRFGYYKDAITALEKHINVVLKNPDVGVLTCELYISIRRNFKCERMLPELQKAYPDNTKVKLIHAKLLMSKHQYQAASNYLDANLKNSKEESVAELKAILFGQVGDFNNAFIQASYLTEKWPDNLAYQIIRADIAIRLGRTEEATEIVKKALRLEPNHLGAKVVKARIAFQQDKRAEAIELLESVVKEKRDNLSALLLLGQIYTLEKQFDLAIDRLLIAKALNASSPEPRELLVSIYRQTGDLKNAISEINQLLNLDRLNSEYMLKKADILIEQRNYPDAASQLNVVYATWSDKPFDLLRLSKIQRSALDLEGAERSIKRAIELKPKWEQAHAEFINFLIEQAKLESAKEKLSTYAKMFGENANYLVLQGDLLLARNEVEKAFANYLKSHQSMTSFNLPLLKLYVIAQQNEQYRSKFINYVRGLTSKSSQSVLVRQILADALMLDKQYDEAERIYTALLDEEKLPQRAFILNNMANIYTHKDIEKALDFSQQALEISGNSAPLLDTYGWLLVTANQLEKGLDTLRRAYAVNSEDPTIQYHIAATLDKLGKKEEAKQELLRNNTLDKVFPDKAEAEELFNRLK